MKQYFGRRMSLVCLTMLLGRVISACADGATSTPGQVTSSPVSTTSQISSTTAAATIATQTGSPTGTATSSTTAATVAVAPQIQSVTGNGDQVGLYNKFELNIALRASYTNPFDPKQVDLHATFTSPTGKSSTVPGFYSQNFDSQLDGKKEVLNANGQPAWKVRFSPTETGQWVYVVEVATPAGSVRSTKANLQVVNSTNPGYLRVSQRDPAYFEFSNGAPYFAIGQNVAWYGSGGTHDYERWFKAMAGSGANFARVWMADWAMGIEWSDAPPGAAKYRKSNWND